MHLESKKVSMQFFWILFLLYAVVYMTKNCFSAAMASIVHEGVLTKAQTGFITTTFYIFYAPLQILGGLVVDRHNPEKLIKIGLIGGAIANLVIFLNQNYYVMLGAWAFCAITQFALWPSVFKIISSQLENEYKVKGVCYITFSSPFGLVLAYLVAAILPKWQYNFMISAVALFGFAILFHIIGKRVEKHMVQDTKPIEVNFKNKQQNIKLNKVNIAKVFLISGFPLMVFATILRYTVSSGIQTISATLLMESYKHISPSVGNLLNILIIIAGIVGIITINQFLYPRLIHNEAIGIFLLLGISLPIVIVMQFVGKVPVVLMIVLLCIAAALLTGSNLLMSRSSVRFAKYGKNGLAAGIDNSAASTAVLVHNWGILSVAEGHGWLTVIRLWMVFLVVAVVCIGISVPLWEKFRKQR